MDSSIPEIPYTVTRDDELNFKIRISTYDYHQLLYKTLNHRKFKGQKYKSVIENNKSGGNFLKHFKVLITFDNFLVSPPLQQEHQFYVKFLDGNLLDRRKEPVSRDSYYKEEFFYNYLLEEQKNLGLDVSFAPKLFYCAPYVLYFEDISLRGFENMPKEAFFDLDHCKLALGTLAKFHSNTIMLEMELKKKKQRGLLGKHSHIFRENLACKEGNDVVRQWFKYNFKAITDVASVFPFKEFQNGSDFMRRLIKLTDYWKDELGKLNDKYQNTVLHGDLLSNNFLFRYEFISLDMFAPVECIIIDYQLLKYGPPAFDVLNMIYSNTRRKFREIHLQCLVDYYYECLTEHLLLYDMKNPITKSEYLEVCEDFKIIFKLQSVCDRCVMLIPDSYAQLSVMRDDDFRRFLFERKLETFNMCYTNNNLFRTMLIEDMEELRDMLYDNAVCL